jgi:PadR family transcriptional regulator PadR
MPGRRFNPRLPPRLPKDLRTGWLLLLLRDGPSYGYVLRRELGARGLEVEPSALYRSLRELESDGLIASSWMQPGPGPRARVYTVTTAGLHSLERLAAGIDRARRAQEAFLSAYGDPHEDDGPLP